MLAAVDKIREAKARSEQMSKVVVDLHPDRPDQRGAALKPAGADGSSPAEYVAWGADPSFEDLENAGGKVKKERKKKKSNATWCSIIFAQRSSQRG